MDCQEVTMKQNIVRVLAKECLMCGATKDLTSQHCIARRHNPKKNVIIGLCLECHRICDAPYIQKTYYEAKALGKAVGHSKNLVKLLESLKRRQRESVSKKAR